MKRHPHAPLKGRRDFLKKSVFIGAAAVLAAAGGRETRASARRPASDASARGYRLTKHIRRYYERASL